MPRVCSHPLTTWLCLIWFGLANTVLAGGMVVCRDGHGGISIEWGCERNDLGECTTANADEERPVDPVSPRPCEDTPVPSELQLSKAPSRATGELTDTNPALVATLVGWASVPQTFAATVGLGRFIPDRPPDVLKHIRSVVFLV